VIVDSKASQRLSSSKRDIMGTLSESKGKKSEKSCGMNRNNCCRNFLLVNTIVLLLQGLFFIIGFEPLFSAILEDKMTIVPTTPAYEVWKKPSIPTTIKFYLFSVRNPKQVENGDKPDLEEVGPFTYREELERVNEEFYDNGTVSYETKKNWFFLCDQSASLESVITTVDVPVLATAEFGRGNYFMELSNYGMFQTRSGLFVNRTARELLFEGSRDPLLDVGSLFAKKGGIPMDKFGWFYKRNGTTWSDGRVTMATGSRSYSEVGDIKRWKGSNRTIYPSTCGDLRGTSAGFTPVDLDREFVDYFSTDICRPIRFTRENETVVEGVKGTRFVLNATDTFGNASTNPDNWCYNANLPYGVHNSTGCKGGDTTLKTFVSLPHFLDADPSFREQFTKESMKPDRARHSSSMTLQMETSIPIQVLMRLQIILQLRPNPRIGLFFEKIPEVFLPVLWFDAEAAIDEEMASQVKMLAVMPTAGLLFGVISLAGAALCLVLFLYLRQKKVTNSVTPSATPAEKVDISIDMRSKTLRTPVVETSQI